MGLEVFICVLYASKISQIQCFPGRLACVEEAAKAAGIKLKDIINIDYSWGVVNFQSCDFEILDFVGECVCESVNECMSLETEDIEKSDQVTVIWEIFD